MPDLTQADRTELAFFTQASCAPCQFFKPIVHKVAQELGLPLREIDAQTSPQLVEDFSVTRTPTLIVFIGGLERARFNAPVSATTLRAAIAYEQSKLTHN